MGQKPAKSSRCKYTIHAPIESVIQRCTHCHPKESITNVLLFGRYELEVNDVVTALIETPKHTSDYGRCDIHVVAGADCEIASYLHTIGIQEYDIVLYVFEMGRANVYDCECVENVRLLTNNAPIIMIVAPLKREATAIDQWINDNRKAINDLFGIDTMINSHRARTDIQPHCRCVK